MEKDILTKGDVIVNKLKKGDITYEFEYGYYIKAEVIEEPVRDEEGMWTWKAKNTKTGQIINYGVNEKYSHYSPNLYTSMAYMGCKQI